MQFRFRPIFTLIAAFFAIQAPQTASAMGRTRPTPIPRDMIDGVAAEKISNARPEIDAIAVEEIKKQGLVGLGIAVFENGKVTYKRGYGFAHRENDIPTRASITKFRWASTSKSVTGVAAVLAAQAGKLNLDKDIRTYWKDYQIPCTYGKAASNLQPVPDCNASPSKNVLTTRMLLNHSAGIAHYSNGVGNPNPPTSKINSSLSNTGIEWATSYVQKMPLVALPWTASNYTTFGFNLAGVVIEKAMGKSFFNHVKATIIDPLGLTTMQPDYRWKSISNRARGYNKSGSVDSFNDVSWKLPGGGFISTVEDMAKYCGGLTGNKVVNDAGRKELWTKSKLKNGATLNYGLGFSVGTHYGANVAAHSGSQEGTSTYMAILIDKKTCVAVMSNNEGANMRNISLRIEKGLIDGTW